MKKILSALTLAAALVAVSVQQASAQVESRSFVVAAGATTNVTAGLLSLDCSSQRNVALKWTFNLNGAGTEVMGLRLIPSVDGTLPSTPSLATGYSLAVAANGTTPVTVQTNFDTLGYRYLHITWMTNGSGGQIVTNQVDNFIKRNAP